MVTNAFRHQRSVLEWGLVVCIAAAAAACSQDGGGGPGTGGNVGSGGANSSGGSNGSGGANSSGGATGSGGAVGSGGVHGSGGDPGSGGAPGSGGGNGSGGSSGSGGSPAGGGASGKGGETGNGGNSGSGGSPASGGTSGSAGANGPGGATGGGNGGSHGSGGAGGASSCNGRVLSLDKNTAGGNDAAKARVEVDFAGSSDLPTGATDRTIEFWAWMPTATWAANNNTTFFYGKLPSARNADGFGLDFGSPSGGMGTTDAFTNAVFDNDNQPSGVSTSPAQWVHFAMTWDGTAVRVFVNGVEKSAKTASGKVLMTGGTVLTIGGYSEENSFFNGYFDEFRVWKVARTAAEITSTMKKTLTGNEAGLTGYWKFDDNPGSMTAADSVTSAGHTAHPGMLMASSAGNMPTFITPSTPSPITCP